MKISLYIPCYNAAETIGPCLDAVLKQTLSPDEIIVVDDGSTDQIQTILQKYPVRIIQHSENKGLGAVRNTALHNVRGDFVASLDGDCVPEPDWLERLMKLFYSDRVGGVGGRLVEKFSSSICDRWRTIHMPQSWQAEERAPLFLFGANTVFRREVILKAGLYNEKFQRNYEDVDLCKRLSSIGYNFGYDSLAVVYHIKKDTLQTVLNSFWHWHVYYYEQEGFYTNQDSFEKKLKDSIGLANRLLDEDFKEGRHELLYLNFLLALHHCLKDWEYFYYQSSFSQHNYEKREFWLSLFDLIFFYHFKSNQKRSLSFLPSSFAFIQNYYVLLLLIGKHLKGRFESEQKRFPILLCKHLLLSVFNVDDACLAERVGLLIFRRNNWEHFMRTSHPYLETCLLEKFSQQFITWLNGLIYHKPTLVPKILWAAEKTDKELILY